MPTQRRDRARTPPVSTLAALHITLKESLSEDNEARRWHLQKLRDLNAVSKFMAEQIAKMVDASQALAAKERESADSSTEKVSLSWAKPRTDSVGADGKVIVIETRSKTHTSRSLGAEMKIAADCLEAIRNKKQLEQTVFEHIDKVTNETMNTISRVLRALSEMRQEGAARRGGL